MNICFFRSGKSYYYILNGYQYEVNDISLNKLMEELKLPFSVTFDGMSIAQIQKICGRLRYNDIECILNNKGNQIIANFYEKVYSIDVYCVPYKACLYGRNPECKPYILSNLGDKKILIEVTFDYATNCSENVYFLHDELTKSEQNFFSSLHTKLEVDCIYNIKQEEDIGLKRRRK